VNRTKSRGINFLGNMQIRKYWRDVCKLRVDIIDRAKAFINSVVTSVDPICKI
jgi:hypothetical protein